MSLLRSAGRGIQFAVAITCKTFEKRQPPVNVVATKAQKVKVNFEGDNTSGTIVPALSGKKNSVTGGKGKSKPRKSPALRNRSPARSGAKTKAVLSPVKGKQPSVASVKKSKPASPKKEKKRKSPTRTAAKKAK